MIYPDLENIDKGPYEFVIGNIHSHSIICANGRFHYYEGHEYSDVAIIIDLFKEIGAHMLL